MAEVARHAITKGKRRLTNTEDLEEEALLNAVIRLNARVLALVLGTLFGLVIFVSTNWLLIKGGHVTPSGEYVVGPHLRLLSQFFIGYDVSFVGSLIGFLYGFVVGAVCGGLIGWIYNWVLSLKKRVVGKRSTTIADRNEVP